VLRHVDLSIERGDRFALVGLNGRGKTTLLRLMAGQLSPGEGRRVLGHKVTVGYQSQEFTDTMPGHLTVLETMQRLGADATEQAVRTLLGGFGFGTTAIDKPVQVLSGGEKVRLAFARLLLRPPNFLLLDEPTTHLDIAARQALEEALAAFAGTLCIVSHDIAFVRRVATDVIAMTPPGVTRYWGDYDVYRAKLAEREAAAEAARRAAATERPAAAARSGRRARAERVQAFSKRRRAIRNQIERVEKKIEALESEQGGLLATLQEGREGLDYEELNRGLAGVQQKLNDENRRWEALAIELDDLEREYGRP
jgi:ATP-binding cassette subfamily F protein 3